MKTINFSQTFAGKCSSALAKEAAHYIDADVDGGGQQRSGYWRQFLTCSDGEVVCGVGPSAKVAEQEAAKNKAQHEQFLADPPYSRLRKIMGRTDWTDFDRDQAIRALAQLVLQDRHV